MDLRGQLFFHCHEVQTTVLCYITRCRAISPSYFRHESCIERFLLPPKPPIMADSVMKNVYQRADEGCPINRANNCSY